MRISRSKLRTFIFPLLGIVPGTRVHPLGNIDLPVTFNYRSNFRTKTMIFEVVDFEGSNHAILRRPCYAKFMVVPNYTYLKLKMPGPNGVITVSGSYEQAYACGHEHFELATSIANSAKLQKLHRTVEEGAPDCNELSPSSAFCPTKDPKAIGVDPNDPTKTVKIWT
jgi:hypothetical protein